MRLAVALVVVLFATMAAAGAPVEVTVDGVALDAESGTPVVRLDENMHVVDLHAEVDDAKGTLRERSEASRAEDGGDRAAVVDRPACGRRPRDDHPTSEDRAVADRAALE